MQKLRRLTAVLIILAALFICAGSCYAASNFIIEDYDIEMTVNEDDTYDIHETLKVHFTQKSHGIYRTIPYRTRLDRDGQVSEYYAKVKDFKMISKQPVKLEKRNDSAYYRIGDANKYEDEDTVYEYTYTYDTGGDRLRNADEVYHNMVGTSWEAQSIDHVSFRVVFPKEIDMSKVGIKTGDQEYVEFETEGDLVVKGETDMDTTGGLTIRAVLPEGYFTRQKKTSNIPLYILVGILGILAASGAVLWRKYGVDPPVVEPVEFYPPEGLSSAEVGYLCDGDITGDHVISDLLSLADRGYLKITETKRKSMFFGREITEYTITKLKSYDGNLTGEGTFMNGLFKSGDTVEVKDLKNSFYKTVDSIKQKIEKKYEKKLKDPKAQHFCEIFTLISFLSMISLVVVSKLTNGSPLIQHGDIFSSIIFSIAAVFLPFIGFYGIASRVNSVKRSFGGFFILLICAIAVIAGWFLAWAFGIFSEEQIAPYSIGLLLVFALCVISALIQRKSDWYTDILGKIRGYRNFLKHAEKDRLETLAEEDPDYFYKTLAFAFALGVTSVFAKNFQSIATRPPEWYETGYYGSDFSTLRMMDSLDSMMKTTGSSMTSSPSDSSGSGGGSFSGGGGGGGGGGGSW